MGKSTLIVNDLKLARQAKNTTEVMVLRSLVASLKNAQIANSKELTETEEVEAIDKEAKKRTDAAAIYLKAGRKDLADKETGEYLIIKKYLPVKLGEDQVRETIEAMKSAGDLGDNFGEAMKSAMQKLKGQADGQLVAKVVRECL